MTGTAAPIATAAPKPEAMAFGSSLRLQRQCGCGDTASGLAGTCHECEKKKLTGLQRKLEVGDSSDRFEQDADRIAGEVLRGDFASPGRAEPPTIRRIGSGSAGLGEAPPIVARVLSSPGNALDAGTRSFFESRFGHDFSRVRVHDGQDADASARAVGARAYTAGSHIAFAAGRLAPRTREGQHLLAHELAHVVQQQGSEIIRRREETGPVAEEKKPGASPESTTEGTGEPTQVPAAASLTFDELTAQEPQVAKPVQQLSGGYRALIGRADPQLAAAKIYDRQTFDNVVQRTARQRVFAFENEIERDGLYDPLHLAQWLELMTTALEHLAPLLRALAAVGAREARQAADAETRRKTLEADARGLAATDYLRRGAAAREKKANAAKAQEHIEAAVEYIRAYLERVWRPDLSDQEGRLHGIAIASRLVHRMHMKSAEVREVLDTLRARSPELLEAALMRGGTVQALLEMGISGLQAYHAKGEGFFAGAIRANKESRQANRPGQRTFSLTERLAAAAGFVGGTIQGIALSLYNNVKGIVDLFTRAFWNGMIDFFKNFLPKFIDNEDFRFELGQMLGMFSADEERRLAKAEPLEYGRTFGEVFGMALTEIVLTFVGLGVILKAVVGTSRLQKIAKPLVAIANAVAKTAVASRLIRIAEGIAEVINALSLRVRRLTMLLPDITPNARLRRTLFEIEETERKVQKAIQRANELEAAARKALAAGDNEAAQKQLAELADTADDIERQIGAATTKEPRGGAEGAGTADKAAAEGSSTQGAASKATKEGEAARATEASESVEIAQDAAKADKALVRKELPDGHALEVNERRGVCLCSPPPCPQLKKTYAKELRENPGLAKDLEAAEKLADPIATEREAEEVYEQLKKLRKDASRKETYLQNPERIRTSFKRELADNPELAEALANSERTRRFDPARAEAEAEEVYLELQRIREEEAVGRAPKVDPYFKDLDALKKAAGGETKAAVAARKKFAANVQSRMPKDTKVSIVNTERTEAGIAQGRAASRGQRLPDPDFEYVIDLPNDVRKKAGLELRPKSEEAMNALAKENAARVKAGKAPREPKAAGTDVFKPDDIRFSGKEGEQFLFFDHKEVERAWADSFYGSEKGSNKLRDTLQRHLQIAEAMGPNCLGVGYTTNSEELAIALYEIIESLPGAKGKLFAPGHAP